MSLRHFPDVWLELAAWHESEGRAEEAASALERAREAIPTCALLHFAAADLEEARGDAVAAKAVYESLLDVYEAKANDAAETAVADGSVASAADFAHPPMDNETLLAYVEYLPVLPPLGGFAVVTQGVHARAPRAGCSLGTLRRRRATRVALRPQR